MGIFTRFRDIVASNINAMLDKAEDPEKMVRLIIQEMEDTLVEVKSNCAAVMAEHKKIERALADTQSVVAEWESRAKLAVEKGRDDLARAALTEKRRYAQRQETLGEELERTKEMVRNYQEDIRQLEAKLADAREKQRSLIHRRTAAYTRRQAQERLRKVDTTEAFAKFEAYENGIERLEAEAEILDKYRPKGNSLHDQFASLEHEDEIEQELQRLKGQSAQPAQ